MLKLKKGEIDLLQNDLSPELMHYLSEDENLRTESMAGDNFAYIGFNLKDPLSGQLAIRRAIAYAIDREAIIRHVWKGRARLAETLLPLQHWAVSKEPQAYAYNPDKAKALLHELGYSVQNPLQLEYKTSTNPLRIRLATVMQYQLAQVGIQLKIRSLDWGTFFADIKAGRFQMYSLKWVGINTPDIYRYVFHSQSLSPQGANRGRYRNIQVDQLIEQAEQQNELAERTARYDQINQLLHDDLVYLPLWYEDQFVAMRNNISHYRLAADGNYDGLQWIQKNTHD